MIEVFDAAIILKLCCCSKFQEGEGSRRGYAGGGVCCSLFLPHHTFRNGNPWKFLYPVDASPKLYRFALRLKNIMIEPLAVTGAISFALALTSFLSSTISTLARQGSEARQCEDRLKAYSSQLRSIQLDLMNWKMLWYGDKSFSEEAYIYCWGVDGYTDIKTRFLAISGLTATVKRHLVYDHNSISRHDRHYGEWAKLIQQLELEPSHEPRPRHFLERVAFALFSNSRMEEEIARLKRLTEDFTSCCLKTLRQRQGIYTDKPLMREELVQLEDTRRFSKGLSNFAKDLYFHAAQNPYKWSLALRAPDSDSDATQTDNPASISMDFLVEGRCICKLWTAARFRIQYHTQHSTGLNISPTVIGLEMQRQLESCTDTTKSEAHIQQLTVQDDPKSKGPSIRQQITNVNWYSAERKAHERDRMLAALGLVNWVCQLWKTPWISAPCLCKISPTASKHAPGPHVLQSSCSRHTEPPCFDADIAEDSNKLFLLGRMLAELASAKPLGIVRSQTGQLLFVKDGKTVTKEEVLQDLRRVGKIGILEAIRYCLLTEDQGPHERAEKLRKHAQNIIPP